ncbi:hypothetical protein LCGC14_0357260 [marine sediment metagenome]|uniref:Thymidylate synthase (FAD) n=1 Tax=marine sediment metagenome TaxID=412755 RepID=A0A0F9TS11_9ZZZZ
MESIVKLIKPSYEILGYHYDDLLQHIEVAGRTCYKSEGKITEGSAEKFCRGMVERGHESVLEHATVCFLVHEDFVYQYAGSPFINITTSSRTLISGNIRAFRDFYRNRDINSSLHRILAKSYPVLFEDIPVRGSQNFESGIRLFDGAMTDEEALVHKTMSIRFICDRGVTHEMVRHRLASYSQESTRYCDYKGGLQFVIPPWVDLEPGEYTGYEPCQISNLADKTWYCAMLNVEATYQSLRNDGWPPQQARSVLPNSLKTEIVMTANVREWRHVFKLRCSPKAHPQIREIMQPLRKELQERVPVLFDE